MTGEERDKLLGGSEHLPVRHSSNSSTFRPHRQAVDLRGIQPRNTQHAQSERNVVEEEPDDAGVSRLLLAAVAGFGGVVQEDGHHEEAEELAGGGDEHHHAAAAAFDEWGCDGRGDEIDDGGDGCDEAGHGVGEADACLEEGGEVVGHDVDAAELGIVSNGESQG